MTARLPRVAVIGRQNVGKSTLVNRLFGRRETIAHDTPGATRDRIEVEAMWRGRRFGLVDTAGFLAKARGVEAVAAKQSDVAVAEADLILLLVDAQTGISEEDAQLARRLRRTSTPVLLVANKIDVDPDGSEAASFSRLGLGEPFAVSALHGRGTGDLLDRMVQLLPTAPAESEIGTEPSIALIGRPNVGKSSLFNRLLGEERSVVHEEAGTTRDAVDVILDWPDGPVRFVDTAGMRKATRTKGLEYYGLVRTTRAIERADVVALVIDASEGLTSEDRKIASRVHEAGRGLLLVANKWDLLEDRDRTFREIAEAAVTMASAPVARTSALRGQGVHRLPYMLIELRGRWASRAPTARVNELIQAAQGERPAPRAAGPIRYATQVATGPPSFVLFGGKQPDPSYRRFLENRLRSSLRLEGVPIRLRFRQRQGRRGGADR